MKSTTKDLVFIALSTTIIIICSLITIPFVVPFTLQTFAIFTLVALFGTKRTLFSVILYLLLGAVGLPVFSGFQGGIGSLLGITGGYLLGFLCTVCVSGSLYKFLHRSCKPTLLSHSFSMLPGLVVCYLFGTLWYVLIYTNSTELFTTHSLGIGSNDSLSASVMSVLSLCVFPFILPDMVKLIVSYYVAKLLKKRLHRL